MVVFVFNEPMVPDMLICLFCTYLVACQVYRLFLPCPISFFFCVVNLGLPFNRYCCLYVFCPLLVFNEAVLSIIHLNCPFFDTVPVFLTGSLVYAPILGKPDNVVTVLQKPFLVFLELYYQPYVIALGNVKSFF